LKKHKRSEYDEDVKVCFHRKLIINEQIIEQEVIKTNYKSVNNKINK